MKVPSEVSVTTEQTINLFIFAISLCATERIENQRVNDGRSVFLELR